MELTTTIKTQIDFETSDKEVTHKELSDVKDYRDLENSVTDWNAEQNQSGRHK